MKVKIRLFASLREITRIRERVAEVAAGTTPAGLLAAMVRDLPALEGLRAHIIFAVNGDYVAGDAVLNDGDEVAFIPPVSGGRAGRRETGGSGGCPRAFFHPTN
ncbi:MAG: molybdopterin converting factor subunit 1 [Dehalococcoidia bacterium]|nr:molybdopterin converting factor subunit 1 [Dehalococcoidia bacterium]